MITYKYRTFVKKLIDKYDSKEPATKVSLGALADYIDVSRNTLYIWRRADSESPEDWLETFDMDTAMKFYTAFENLLDIKLKMEDLVQPMRLESNTGNHMVSSWSPLNFED